MPKLRWNCEEDGCFNEKCRPKIEVFDKCFPGLIAFTDIDWIVERHGQFVFMEWKMSGCELTKGQRILLEQLSMLAQFTVIVVWGDAEKMTVTRCAHCRRAKFGDLPFNDLESLQQWLIQWAAYAEQAA